MGEARNTGIRAEQAAVVWLEQKGYQIVARNFHCRQGEVDIIAEKEEQLVFIEVKYRKTQSGGMPEEQVDIRKQRKIIKASIYYMWKHGIPENRPCRFDVIAISGENIRHIEDAFMYME